MVLGRGLREIGRGWNSFAGHSSLYGGSDLCGGGELEEPKAA
jgi:hypothetical protein